MDVTCIARRSTKKSSLEEVIARRSMQKSTRPRPADVTAFVVTSRSNMCKRAYVVAWEI
jgi:hypothetical protein